MNHPQKRLTSKEILKKKKSGEKITMLTAYDYPMARVIDQAGIDIILVGDSLANVVLGLDSTRDIGMEEMIYHAKAVNRAVENALLVGDMPFRSYEDMDHAVSHAGRFKEEAGCDAIKLEWTESCADVAEAIIQSGIPVMGHVGLTPQAVTSKDGFRVQGKDAPSAEKIILQARELERRGCFSIVLECIPKEIGQVITQELKIPTISCGAGPYCDGQVLVTHDLLGYFDRYKPKFVKQYANLNELILKAVTAYREEVKKGQFPDEEHSFSVKKEELDILKKLMKAK
ncbi:MAG: 3-methyl-2-oxobutanoate hydroxymethyltransferase [Candidatus Omnitrophota bacterium]